MNNQFLQHLKSITPQGRAEDTKIFIPADRFQDGNSDSVNEGTRMKYVRAYKGKDEGRKASAWKRRTAAILRRGGADPESIRREVEDPIGSSLGGNVAARKASKLFGGRAIAARLKAKAAGKKVNLNEATRSKYIKAYRKHRVGTDTSALDLADAKRNAAVLRRGGADPETIRKGSFTGKIPMSHYNDVNMARYRFGNKAEFSRSAGKKSPRSVKEAVSDPRGDPNRGGPGRAKPKLDPGMDPYDLYTKGKIRPYGGKLQKRLRSMSAEDRKRYYETIGIRSRAASRGGKTRRLFPVTEAASPKKALTLVKKAKRGLKKMGKKIGRALSTPQSGTDFEITGRKF